MQGEGARAPRSPEAVLTKQCAAVGVRAALEAASHLLGQDANRRHVNLSCRLLPDQLQFGPQGTAVTMCPLLELDEGSLLDIADQDVEHGGLLSSEFGSLPVPP
jgi:hypothetical protein